MVADDAASIEAARTSAEAARTSAEVARTAAEVTAPGFPFSAVVGQDELKLALLLNAVDPAVGGVLLRGDKGSAKSTLARALAGLLGGSPFVELPIGATEDRLAGSLDLTTALAQGELRFRPGLLAGAHGGVLYVDEVNLLPDHLVDLLLDVAASGCNRVEREGVSHTHAARFVLIGSMNPEEGELRPQLLDRFGLSAAVTAPVDPDERALAVERRLAFDADPVGFAARWAPDEGELAARLGRARPAVLPGDVLRQVSTVCAAMGAEGLRADLVMCRAAAALAGWEGRSVAEAADVRRVAALALAHRSRRSPLDDHGLDEDALDQTLDDVLGERPPPAAPGIDSAGERVASPDAPTPVVRLSAPASLTSQPGAGRRSTVRGDRGRLITDRPPGPDGPASVAVGATVRAALARQPGPGAVAIAAGDLREAVREQRVGNLIVLVVDASGSMGVERRMEAAKGAVLSLLVDAYQRRDRVALISFGGAGATVALRPTGSVEVARARLADLPTGGRTPLAEGILAALDVAATGGNGSGHEPMLVLVTDGRATAAPEGVDPVAAALDAAGRVRRQGVAAVVVDAEDGPTRLGLARGLAEAMGGRYLRLPELTGAALAGAVVVNARPES